MTDHDVELLAQRYVETVIQDEQKLGYEVRVPDEVRERASRLVENAIRELSEASRAPSR